MFLWLLDCRKTPFDSVSRVRKLLSPCAATCSPSLFPLYLYHEVPGINIPKHFREKLAALPPEDATRYGVEVTQNLLSREQSLVGGAYIMPPASAPDLAGDVMEAIDKASGKRTGS